MLANPEINRSFEGDLRGCRFELLPYALSRRIENETIVQVLAVMHQHREPGWRERADA